MTKTTPITHQAGDRLEILPCDTVCKCLWGAVGTLRATDTPQSIIELCHMGPAGRLILHLDTAPVSPAAGWGISSVWLYHSLQTRKAEG